MNQVKNMKKTVLAIVVITLILLSLPGCAVEEAALPGYAGTMEGYSWYHTQERDRAWEEDVLFLADKFLDEHPFLSGKPVTVETCAGLTKTVRYSLSTETYNEALREAFLEQVNDLIVRIPQLSDEGILYEMQSLIAGLEDAHSFLGIRTGEILPVFFEPVFEGEQAAFLAVRAPEEHQDILGCILTAINDISIEEIVENLSPYVSCENAYGLAYKLADPDSYTLLTQKSALQHIGVLEPDAESAELTFETENGSEKRTMGMVSYSAYEHMKMVSHPMVSEQMPRFQKDGNYWCEALSENVLYIRLRVMQQDDAYPLYRLLTDVRSILENQEAPQRVVIDFRDNLGWDSYRSEMTSLASMLNQYKTDGVYVVINGKCLSAGVIVPYMLTAAIDEAQLIGTPAGQFVNFCMNNISYSLPNAGNPFWIPRQYYRGAPYCRCDALYPEITVRQTWEDFLSGEDSVMKYILAVD